MKWSVRIQKIHVTNQGHSLINLLQPVYQGIALTALRVREIYATQTTVGTISVFVWYSMLHRSKSNTLSSVLNDYSFWYLYFFADVEKQPVIDQQRENILVSSEHIRTTYKIQDLCKSGSFRRECQRNISLLDASLLVYEQSETLLSCKSTRKDVNRSKNRAKISHWLTSETVFFVFRKMFVPKDLSMHTIFCALGNFERKKAVSATIQIRIKIQV